MKKYAKKAHKQGGKKHRPARQPVSPQVLDRAAELEMKRRDADFDKEFAPQK